MTLTVFWEGRDDVKPLCLYEFLGYARGYNGKDNARRVMRYKFNKSYSI